MSSTSRAAGDGELEPDPEAVQRRLAGAQTPHGRAAIERALVSSWSYLIGLQPDVVAEPLRLLVRVGVAADVDEQRGVVDDRPLLLVEPDALGEPERDQALAEDMLHRLPEAEIDPERERGDELRQPDLRATSLARHPARLSR